jgi:4-hydroxy-2-oxoheptanedioate aldolase
MGNLKERLRQGETIIGCWLNLGNSITAEIVGSAGFDWVLVDLEHGSGTEKDLLYQLQAIESTAASPIVRVESYRRQRIQRALDFGAAGIMCPQINNESEAKKVADNIIYPTEGNRGVAKMVRASGFGRSFSVYRENMRENLLGVVQIETIEALNHVEQISAVDGVDVLFIGPGDLSMQLGIFGQFDHPKFRKVLDTIVDAAQKAGKTAGMLLYDPTDFGTYCKLGIQMVACGSDGTFISNGATNMVNKLNLNKDNKSNK